MILPIITAVTREVFVQTPQGEIEAALALGATRWEVVKTTVLPFGRSGYISGAMLGLGRALGETVALLIILRGTQTAFGWSLFDGGSTFATKIAATASEFDDQYKAGAYIAAGLVLFLLTFVVDALARGAVTGTRARRAAMTSILDRPLKARTILGARPAPSSREQRCDRAGDAVDGDRADALGVGAVLGRRQGVQGDHVDRVVDAFASGYDGICGRRRRLPRDRRHRAAGIGMRRDLHPDRRDGRDLSGRVRRRHPAGQAGLLHGGHPGRCALDRGGIVHLRGVGGDAGLPAFGVRGVVGTGAVDAPGDRAGDRGDAADRSGGSSRGQLRARCPEVENHCPGGDSDRDVRHRDRDPVGGGQGDG